MSRNRNKGKNKNKPQTQVTKALQPLPQPPLPQQASPAPQPQSTLSRPPSMTAWKDLRVTLTTGWLKESRISLVVATLSVVMAFSALRVSNRQEDRASGKLRAHFEVDGKRNHNPSLTKAFLRKPLPSDPLAGELKQIHYVESPDHLMRWAPSVAVKNVGEEIIDGIKVEVHLDQARSYGVGVVQIDPVPLVIKDTTVREVTSFGKLMPGKSITVVVVPLLLDQMLKSKSRAFPDADREGIFRIRVSCRIAGSAIYDANDLDKAVWLDFHWGPKGFTDLETCNDIINHELYLFREEELKPKK